MAQKLDPRSERVFGEWYRSLASNIYAFCAACGHKPTRMQMSMLDEAQLGTRRVACRSGQGTGKTKTMAIIQLWHNFSRTFGRGIITAPSMRQAQNVALNEMKQVIDNAPDKRLQSVFHFLKGSVGLFGHDSETWGTRCVTASSPEGLQGLHAEHLLIWAEETSGIPRALMETLYGTCSGPSNWLYCIGNPNSRNSAFFEMFHADRAHWRTLHWNSELVPDSKWFDQSRNRFVAEKYGKDSDVYRVRCTGEFPRVDATSIIDPEKLEECSSRATFVRAMCKRDFEGKTIRQFGIDFARFGNDESTIYRRSGDAIVQTEFFSHTDPSVVVDAAFRMQADANWKDEDTQYVPDANGMGQGIMHRFHNAGKRTFEFYSQGRANEEEYDNAATEAWFSLARKVKELAAHIPHDSRLMEQLTNRRYYTTKKGKLIVESKDEYMRRGFDSPDRADGCIMAYYDRAQARAQHASGSAGVEMSKKDGFFRVKKQASSSGERTAGSFNPLGNGIGVRR